MGTFMQLSDTARVARRTLHLHLHVTALKINTFLFVGGAIDTSGCGPRVC